MTDPDPPPHRPLLTGLLDWLYDRVSRDLPAATEPGASDRDIDRWIARACTQAGAAGFVTNMGGLLTLPAAIPANLAGTAAVQMRLIARIAASRGYDTHSEAVKTFVLACLLGKAATDVLKGAGLQIGARLGQRLSAPVLRRLNSTVLAKLAARMGAQGAVNITKIVPFMSGLIGGGLDAASTRVVGAVAKRVFVRQVPEPVLEAATDAPKLLPAPEGR